MIKRTALAFCLLMLSAWSFSQPEKKINTALATHNYGAFKKLADKYSNLDSIRIAQVYDRELVSGFFETVFYFDRYDVDGHTFSVFSRSKINIIRQGNRLIYYVAETDSLNGKPPVVSRFTDQKAYDTLKSIFARTFDAPLNEKESFIDSIAYGSICGHYPPGQVPKEKKLVDQWAAAKDRSSLLKWLQSTNTEKQLYAVWGFWGLYQRRVALTAREKEMLDVVMKKKGNIRTCGPCDLRLVDISEIVKIYHFQ